MRFRWPENPARHAPAGATRRLSYFAWNSPRRAEIASEIASEHPQVGVGDNAVTLPSMQKAARDLSSRRVPLVRVPLVLGSVAFWCRA